MRKSWSKGFILSLSGGVDSATCAALVYHMCERLIKELGLTQTQEKTFLHTGNKKYKNTRRTVRYFTNLCLPSVCK